MPTEIRVTCHSGRYNKKTNKVYSPDHNDRNFESENERKNQFGFQNVYVVKTGLEGLSFAEAEKKFYNDTFGAWLEKDNIKKKATGHAGRQRTIEQILSDKRMAPQETVLQVGTRKHRPQTMKEERIWINKIYKMGMEYCQKVGQEFPQYKTINFALHLDEDSIHIQERGVFMAKTADGDFRPHQREALLQMGVERPDPTKPRGQHNNEKQTFTERCRTIWQDLTRSYFPEFTLVTEPKTKGKRTMDKEEWLAQKIGQEVALQQQELNTVRNNQAFYESEIERQKAENAYLQSQNAYLQSQNADLKQKYDRNAESIAQIIANAHDRLSEAEIKQNRTHLERIQDDFEGR